ncbi:MAG: hypothetical protein GY820_31590, partial [Gammaproteobacteria bacterium]|nr:hypothetical protein [Gammaproteobacteria bacterium]
YFAFVDLEKAFDRVPRDVVWLAMRKLGVEEWLLKVVQSMYQNVRSRVRVNGECSEEFEVKVGVHQGSVLSLPFFSSWCLKHCHWNFALVAHGSFCMLMT